ncbi:MAG: hypothetical protein JWL75_640 [Parcubacteria group bacterium]|nr:hypothetical protein [Parcubacteria group bacterium]
MNKPFVVISVIVLVLIVGGVAVASMTNIFGGKSPAPVTEIATSTPVVMEAATTTATTTATTSIKTVIPVKKPVVTTVVTKTTVVTPPKPPATALTTTVTPTPTGTTITTTPYPVTNTVKVSNIPLLSGGNAHTGSTVPVSYLQVTNQGTETINIKGFYLKQTGTAPDATVIGFSTVDDKSGSRGSVNGAEGVGVLRSGVGYAPSTAILGPGQMKLFTIKATLSTSAQYIGKTLGLEVTGIDTSLPASGALPIFGATWTIVQ